MARKMTIDSNIVIAYLAGEKAVVQALSEWKADGASLFLSTIVETEVLSFNKWPAHERTAVEFFLEREFISVPFDRTVSRMAALVRRNQPIKLPDAAIAATAIYTNSPLVTRNVRDFRNIQGLEIMHL